MPDETISDHGARWVETMGGHAAGGQTVAHRDSRARVGARTRDGAPAPVARAARERLADATLLEGATHAVGAGRRAVPEEPDEYRTCFERDRDRILHSTAFRRLAGKTQVFIFPEDHMRTRLTHALEVAQVATAMARGRRPQRGADRGGRPRPRLRPRPRRPRQRGRPSSPSSRAGSTTRSGAPTSAWRPSTSAPRPSTGCATTRGRARRPRPPRARSSAGPTGSPTSATTSRTPWPRGSSGPTTCRRACATSAGTAAAASWAPSSPRW